MPLFADVVHGVPNGSNIKTTRSGSKSRCGHVGLRYLEKTKGKASHRSAWGAVGNIPRQLMWWWRKAANLKEREHTLRKELQKT